MKNPILPESVLREIATRKHKRHTVLSEKSITRSGKLVELTLERIETGEWLRQQSRQLCDRSAVQIQIAKDYRKALPAEKCSARRKAA